MKDCKNSYDSGCRCVSCHPGLLAYSAPERREALLNVLTGFKQREAPTRRPRAVPDLPVVIECAGTFTCTCKRCKRQRKELVKHGSREVAQPWQSRPARRAA